MVARYEDRKVVPGTFVTFAGLIADGSMQVPPDFANS
jgi:hypothetical protein